MSQPPIAPRWLTRLLSAGRKCALFRLRLTRSAIDGPPSSANAAGSRTPYLDPLVAFTLGNRPPHVLSHHLKPDIRRRGAIPFAVTDQGAPREPDGPNRIFVTDYRPPADRERRGGAPIHRTEAKPSRRDIERPQNMFAAPLAEERAFNGRPIALQPCLDELIGAGAAKPLHVICLKVFVVRDFRRDKHALQARVVVLDDLPT